MQIFRFSEFIVLPLESARIFLQAVDFGLETWKKAVESGELDEDEIFDISKR